RGFTGAVETVHLHDPAARYGQRHVAQHPLGSAAIPEGDSVQLHELRTLPTPDKTNVSGRMPTMDCAFCEIVAGERPAHVVLDDGPVVAFLDGRPLFKGHTLLVPRTHYETLQDLPGDLLQPFFATAQRLAAAMESVLGAAGSFVAMNNRVSQSVPHLHA